MKLRRISMLEAVDLMDPTPDMHRWVEEATERCMNYLKRYLDTRITELPTEFSEIYDGPVTGPDGVVRSISLRFRTSPIKRAAAKFKAGVMDVEAPMSYIVDRSVGNAVNSLRGEIERASGLLRGNQPHLKELEEFNKKADDYEIELEDTLMHELVHMFDIPSREAKAKAALGDRPELPKSNTMATMATAWGAGAAGALLGAQFGGLTWSMVAMPLAQILSGFLSLKLYKRKLKQYDKDSAAYNDRADSYGAGAYIQPDADFAKYLNQASERTAWISALTQRMRAIVRKFPEEHREPDWFADEVYEALPEKLRAGLEENPEDVQQVKEFLYRHARAALGWDKYDK